VTNEEAIKVLSSWEECKYKPTHNAACLAIAALRAQAQAEKNDPLTLDELREMDGEPVWLTCFDSWRLCYGLSDYRGYLCMETGNGSCIHIKDYGEKWLAYRQRLKEKR